MDSRPGSPHRSSANWLSGGSPPRHILFYPPVPAGRKVEFFPPVLRDQVLSITPRDDNYVVVYQTSSSFTRLPELLKRLPFRFKVFAYERTGQDGNISYFPRSDVRFIEEVGGASWVLTNGGYTLMSEALYLGKPVFSIPVDSGIRTDALDQPPPQSYLAAIPA